MLFFGLDDYFGTVHQVGIGVKAGKELKRRRRLFELKYGVSHKVVEGMVKRGDFVVRDVGDLE